MSAELRQFECNEAEARTLTDDIRRGVERVHLLLVRSYEWGAWRALGYDSWRDYAMAEFGMSKSRAYELLDQARVIKAIEGATGAGSGIPEINAGQAAELAPIVRDHGSEAAASILRQVADEGKVTAAAIRATAEDAGLRPRRTIVSDQVIYTATGEVVEDAARVRVTEEPIRPTIIARPEDPAEREAERRRDWLRKLSDSAVAGYLEFDTVTHPNNLADVAEAWGAFPPVALTSGPITPDMLRATAARITDLAERLEKP